MNDKYINANALRRRRVKIVQSNKNGETKISSAVVVFAKEIDAASACDVKPVVRGRWIMLSYDEACCSVCGYVRGTQFDTTKEAKSQWNTLPKFCEQCGAEVGKGEDVSLEQ